MTLSGTNTYLVDDGAGQLAVIDPGPEDRSHFETIAQAIERHGRLSAVLVTHRHLDHLPLAHTLAARYHVPLSGHPELPAVQRELRDGDAAFGMLVALATPGHTRDSLCFWDAGERVLFSGDLVLGSGTTVLDDAPGALTDYLGSLERLLSLAPRTIYPGHGPVIEDGSARVRDYLGHRRQRVQQVVDALAAHGPLTIDQLVRVIYTDTPEHLYPMAARNVRANLEVLAAQGQVSESAAAWRLIR
jgi:glyoxylase-like metal-dependent hydrolase (beta-lactamase superfamily II)